MMHIAKIPLDNIDRAIVFENKKKLSLSKIIGDNKFEGLVFENTITKKEVRIKTDGVFIAIGHIPCNDIVKNLVDLDKAGYIISNEDCIWLLTSIYGQNNLHITNNCGRGGFLYD